MGGGSLLIEGVRVEAPFDEEGELVQTEPLAHERWHRVLLEPELCCASHKLEVSTLVLLQRGVAADQLRNLAREVRASAVADRGARLRMRVAPGRRG